MPIYEIMCPEHHCIEDVYVVSWRDELPVRHCPVCHKEMQKVMSLPSHPITDENASWIPSTMEVIGDERDNKKRPITKRSEFKKYLDDNNLRQRKSWFDNLQEV